MRRASVIDDRGNRRHLWGTSTTRWTPPGEHDIDTETLDAIWQECERYRWSQWKDDDEKRVRFKKELREQPQVPGVLERIVRGTFQFVLWCIELAGEGCLPVWIAVVLVAAGVYYLFGLAGLIAVPVISLLLVYVLKPAKRRLPNVPHRIRVAAFVRRGLCAQCGYPICGTTEETDGCTVCPECGAAWKLPAPTAENIG